jgi:hypothetical protein
VIYPTQRLVIPDGTGQLPLLSVSWRLPRIADVTIPFAAVGQNGAAFAFTAGDQIQLALKQQATDELAELAIAATFDNLMGGTGHWTISRAQMEALERNVYAVGGQYLRVAGTEDMVILPGKLVLDAAIASL